MKYQNKISDARISAGLTQAQLAEMIGMSVPGLQNYEYGLHDIRSSLLKKISEATGKSMSYLLCLEDNPDFVRAVRSKTIQVPVVGRISAGTPRTAYAMSDVTHDAPASLLDGRDDAFWLIISGNSMNKLFADGTLVLVDPDAEIRNGDVGVVFVDQYDATVKRVYYEDDAVRLHPESYDPEYRDTVIHANDPSAPDFRMIGRVVSYTAPDGWRA